MEALVRLATVQADTTSDQKVGEGQMTRERALRAMDALMGQGYSVHLEGHPPTEGFVRTHDETGEVGYWPVFVIRIVGLGFDSVDIKAIDEIAQTQVGDLEVAWDAHNGLHLRTPDRTPEAVRNARRHPRAVREGPVAQPPQAGTSQAARAIAQLGRRPVRDNPQA